MSQETRGVENYQWLASVIAGHPEATVEGSLRLQNTVLLLQHLGLPSNYSYRKFFDGPYSEAVQTDIGVLTTLGMIKVVSSPAGRQPRYTFQALDAAPLSQLDEFIEHIRIISKTDTSVLDCAATYEAFRDLGLPDDEAWDSVCLKKAKTCNPATTGLAKKFLEKLGLR